MRLNRFFYLIREGFRSIFTNGFMSFASVTIIMACLIIMGSVSLLSVNIDAIIADLESQNEMVAFVDEELDEEAAIAIGDEIRAVANVSQAEFVDRQTAMDNFMSNYDEELMEGIDVDVFRNRYVIHLNDISLMKQTKTQLESVEGIAKVNAHLDYAETFISVRNVVSIVSMVLIVILVFVSAFIMSNTIKLATFYRKDEIAIMKMVGAGNGFIRLPFIVEGLVLGLLGGGLAYFAQWGIYQVLTDKISENIAGSFLTMVPFSAVDMKVLVCFLAAGVAVGVFGGVNAIRNYLKV